MCLLAWFRLTSWNLSIKKSASTLVFDWAIRGHTISEYFKESQCGISCILNVMTCTFSAFYLFIACSSSPMDAGTYPINHVMPILAIKHVDGTYQCHPPGNRRYVRLIVPRRSSLVHFLR